MKLYIVLVFLGISGILANISLSEADLSTLKQLIKEKETKLEKDLSNKLKMQCFNKQSAQIMLALALKTKDSSKLNVYLSNIHGLNPAWSDLSIYDLNNIRTALLK